MSEFHRDIFTESSDIDVNTLANLGPLAGKAGVWEGTHSLDIRPKPLTAPERQALVERIELEPIDPQSNDPQLLYGLRNHTRMALSDLWWSQR